ncbi:flagellar attachment zone protein 1-like protein [Lasius niger]|uniref:Flagellar attachment zone protein 1-like protein n=1 Tax=Lasius niger TaxID=67767 RepID=A0A0J7NFM8_LASNI|nr:flagellar attachment zone protein 1-like protein [Lasius niger]
MDNIYILPHVIRKEVRKKGRKMYGFFMDLKAAFDRVDRKKLWEAMEKRGVRRGLTERVKEIYESTKCAVRSQGRRSEWFWTEKGVRQGCPLSPLLFSILIADVEDEMKKEQVGGFGWGRRGYGRWLMQMI